MTLEYAAPPATRSAWLAYCLVAIMLWGVWGIVSKATERHVSPWAAQVISTIGVVLPALVLLGSPKLKRGDNFLVGGLAAFGTGICGGVGNLLMLLSFAKGGEASVVMPLTGMFPLVTILLAVVILRERMNWVQCLGIAIALAALYLFGVASASGAEGTHVSWWRKVVTPWMAFAIGALVLWGVAGVLQKVATNHISTELSTILFALAFVPVAVVVVLIQRVDWNISGKGWMYAIVFGVLIGVGTLFLFAAYRDGKASIVTALYALYPALTVLMAVPIFGERIDLKKGAAIVLALVAGVALSYERPGAPVVGGEVGVP